MMRCEGCDNLIDDGSFCRECQIKEDNRQAYIAIQREGSERMRKALEMVEVEVTDTTPESGRHLERTVRMVHYPNVIGTCICTLMTDEDGNYIKGWDELYLSLEPHPTNEGEFYAKPPTQGRIA